MQIKQQHEASVMKLQDLSTSDIRTKYNHSSSLSKSNTDKFISFSNTQWKCFISIDNIFKKVYNIYKIVWVFLSLFF